MKVFTGNVLEGLLHAGFDAVYDDPSYKNLKGVYDGPKWANDLDDMALSDLLFHRSLRYAENHDEVRLAGANQWGGIGLEVGRPVSAILFGLGRGPVLLFNGQEVGEPARGAAGYSGEGARTTIFDYWSMAELAKWVNGHKYDGGRLSEEQKSLRAFYSRLLRLVAEPAFRDGEFYSLNPSNRWNTRFGRPGEESASGHWLYAFLRFDPASGQRFLVVANLHPKRSFQDVRIYIPKEAIEFLKLHPQQILRFEERLLSSQPPVVAAPAFEGTHLEFCVASLPPLTPAFFEFRLV